MEFTLILGIAFIGVTVYMANQEVNTDDPSTLLRILLYVMIAMLVMMAFTAFNLMTDPRYPGGSAELWFVVGFTALAAVFSFWLVRSNSTRELLHRLMPKYDSQSAVHTTAVVLALSFLAWTITLFVTEGGTEGLARSFEQYGISLGDQFLNTVLQITVAFLGVGLMIRRTPQQSLERLGLRIPTIRDIVAGLSIGIGLIILQFIFSFTWQVLLPEQFENQASVARIIAAFFSSLPVALFISLCAAFGEEILFRGALQPIFGVMPSSLLFILIHTQYYVTPALLLIFMVSVSFGILRSRLSTSAAIIAHFTYDFIPLAVLALSSGVTQ